MKKILITALIVFTLLFGFNGISEARVSVRGYVTHRGTYVAPHYRTSPDYSRYNNWGTKGNSNPYTGKKGYSNPLRLRYR